MAAAILFPFDVAVRRLVVGEDELNNLSARLRRKQGEAPSNDASVAAKLKSKRATRAEAKTVVAPTRSQTPGGAPQAPPASGRPTSAPQPSVPSSTPEAKPPAAPAEPEELDSMERFAPRQTARARRRVEGHVFQAMTFWFNRSHTMSLTLEIPAEIEAQLREVAARQGSELNAFILAAALEKAEREQTRRQQRLTALQELADLSQNLDLDRVS